MQLMVKSHGRLYRGHASALATAPRCVVLSNIMGCMPSSLGKNDVLIGKPIMASQSGRLRFQAGAHGFRTQAAKRRIVLVAYVLFLWHVWTFRFAVQLPCCTTRYISRSVLAISSTCPNGSWSGVDATVNTMRSAPASA